LLKFFHGLPEVKIMHRDHAAITYLLLLLLASAPLTLRAQQPKSAEAPKTEPAKNTDTPKAADSARPAEAPKAEAQKPETLSPAARLAAARSVYIKRTGGSDIPYTVISEDIQGWGHFVLVNNPEKADLVLEVESPEDTSGLTVGSSTKSITPSGEPDRSSSTWLTKQSASGDVKLSVRDSKSRNVLWRATEQAKSGLKRTSRENSLVEAAERLFVKFHDRIEPPPTLSR
jgi:hypothetical protein